MGGESGELTGNWAWTGKVRDRGSGIRLM